MRSTGRLLPLLFVTFALGAAHADTLTIPSHGAISGSPGQIIGYGFTFDNTSADYAVLDDSYLTFTPGFAAPYTDFLANNFIEIGPGQTFTQQFTYVLSSNPGDTTEDGTGLFTINSNAAVGSSASGMLTVDYDLYNGDPNVGFTQATYGNEVSAAVSLSVVSAPSVNPSPEPASLWLAGAALLGAGLIGRRAKNTGSAKKIVLTGALLLAGVCVLSQPVRAQGNNSSLTDPFQILTNTDVQNECTPQNADSSYKDWNGCCGSPGRRGCIAFFADQDWKSGTCNGPGDILRVDSYSHKVICNLPSPSYDPAVANLFSTSPAGQEFTLYITSDIHFFRTTFNLTDQLNHVNVLNLFAGSGKDIWPAGTGALSGTTIKTPLALVMDGDLTTHAGDADLGAVRLNYEEGAIPGSIKYPVLIGLGNHDINTNVSSSSDAQQVFDYLTTRMNSGSNFDKGSGNYSWDWQGVHMIQLNTWAGDQTSKYSHVSDGLGWLQNDLARHAGNSTTPVMIFQHYGFNYVGGDWPTDATAVNSASQATGKGYESFWNIIKNYNVVGLFSGHSHCLGNYTSATPSGLANYDGHTFPGTANYGSLVDNFDDGSGGDMQPPPCLSQSARGTFLTTHVSNHYLDVAAFGWAGSETTASPQTDMGLKNKVTSSAQSACRKRINSQFIPGQAGTITVNQWESETGYTVTNNTGQTIAGPVALQFNSSLLSNYDFVDQCGGGNGNAYVLVNGENGLAPGQSYSVAAVSDESKPTAVLLTPLSGISPTGLSFTTAFATPNQIAIAPPPQTLTAYGPPNGILIANVQYLNTATNWITVTAPGAFDATGTAIISLGFVGSALQQTDLGNVTAKLNINAATTGVISSALIEITFKAPVTVILTANPPATSPVGSEPEFTAQLKYTPVQIQDGAVAITGLVDLVNQSIDPLTQAVTGSQFLSAEVVNSGNDCITSGNNPSPDNVLFGGLPSSNGNPCPSSIVPSGQIYASDDNPNDHTDWWYSSSLPAGVYSLAASFVGSGTGDSDYTPAVSNTLLYRIGDPLSSASVYAGNNQSAPPNGYFQTPLSVQVKSPAASANGGPKNAVVTFTVKPGSQGQAGTIGGLSSITVFADANGIAATPPLMANGIAGPWYVTATVGGLSATSLPFTLNTTGGAPTPVIRASVTGKSGALASRNWTIAFTNTGTAAAGQMTLASLTFTQEAGPACTPAIVSGLPFIQPLLPSVAGSNSVSTNVGIDFGSCAATSRFTVVPKITADGGAYTTSVAIGHQFP